MAPFCASLLRLGVAIIVVRVAVGAIIVWKPWRARYRDRLITGGVAVAAVLTATGLLHPAVGRTLDLILGAGILIAAALAVGLYTKHRRVHLPVLAGSVDPVGVVPVVIPFHAPGADAVAEADAIQPTAERMRWRPTAREHPTTTLKRHSLLELDPLLTAYEATGAERYLAAAEAMVIGWIRRNSAWVFTPPSVFSWGDHSTALRCCRLIAFWGVWSGSPQSRPATRALLRRSLLAHARLLASPDFYWARHNHGVDQDIALYQASICLGSHHEAEGWRATAWARLWSTLDALVSARGVMREHSAAYQLSTLTHLAALGQLAQACGDTDHADRLITLVRTMAGFTAHLIEPSGRLAPLGDTDANVVLSGHPVMSQCDHEAVASCMSAGIRGTPPPRVSSYAGDGYVFIREGRTAGPTAPDAWYLAFIGASHARRAHKHGDDLSLILTGQGVRILADPGAFSYSGDAWRRYFVSRRAHNTVAADPLGTEVSDFPTGDGRTRLHDPVEHGDLVLLGGSRELMDGRHDRAILWLGGGSVVVVDQIERPRCPVATRLAELTWHLGAGIHVKLGDPGEPTVLLATTGEPLGFVRLHVPKETSWRSVRGATDPIQGWLSPRRDERVPADVLVATESGNPAVFVTEFIFPLPGVSVPSNHASAISDGGIAVRPDGVEVSVGPVQRPVRVRCALGVPPSLLGTIPSGG